MSLRAKIIARGKPALWQKFALCLHTWRKHALVHQITHHVEYSVQMARVNKTSPPTGETCLRLCSSVAFSLTDSSCVRQA